MGIRKRMPRTVHVPPLVEPLLRQIGRFADEQKLPAFAVGGCVRDWLLGIDHAADFDIMIVGDGIAFAKSLARALGVGVISHEQFGTATLMATSEEPSRLKAGKAGELTGIIRIDVASCRKETYAAPAAYPKVSAGTLEDDLFRRDFTINAMAMALSPERFSELVDPFQGLQDLLARRIRILHPRSFIDDPSRILRAARFMERFGCSLDAKTAVALRRAVASRALAQLNRGRLRRELERLVEEPHPTACLACLGGWLAKASLRGLRVR